MTQQEASPSSTFVSLIADPSKMTLSSTINNSFNCSQVFETSCFEAQFIVTGVIIMIICLFGVPANLTVIIYTGRRLHGSSISQRLFFNLALSDLLCLLFLPAGAVIFCNGSRLTHVVCQLLFYFFFFCITADLNILMLISIQRYFQVLHHQLWLKLNRTWQRVLLSSVWIIGGLEALPVVFLLTDVKNEDKHTNSHCCSNQRVAPELEAFYIFSVIFCHFVLFTFYLLLVRGLKQKERERKSRAVGVSKKMRNATKVNQLFARIIAVSLILGLVPLILRTLYVVAIFHNSDELLYFSKLLTPVECLYFCSHCLNPVLYFFASKDGKNRITMRHFLIDT